MSEDARRISRLAGDPPGGFGASKLSPGVEARMPNSVRLPLQNGQRSGRASVWQSSIVGLLIGFFCSLECGCSQKPQPVPVSGRVFYNDKPLPFGVIMFQPERGQLGVGEIEEGGFFKLSSYAIDDGVIPGNHRVCVTCFEGQRPRQMSPDSGGGKATGKLLIPQKYIEFVTSGLTAEVKDAKDQTFEFRLKGPPLKE